jgi:predicted RNA-binding protein YlxR (DUF448 family)
VRSYAQAKARAAQDVYRCGEHKPKRELIRVVRSPEGEISLDDKGKKPAAARISAQNLSAWPRRARPKRLERALSCAIPDEAYEAMLREMEVHEPQG